MSRKPKTKMHRTRIDADAYEIVSAIVAANPDIKGTQAAVRHALLLYPQVASLKTRLKLSEQRGDDWKERAEKAKQGSASEEYLKLERQRDALAAENKRLEELEEAREEEAAVLKGEREENEVLKTRLQKEKDALEQQRDRNFELESEAAEQRYSIRLLKEAAAGRWRPGMVWLFGACIGACLMFGATWLWG